MLQTPMDQRESLMASKLIDSLIKGMGYDTFNSTLLNIPFGCLQAVAILLGSYAAARFKIKSAMVITLALLGLAGGLMLYFGNLPTELNRPVALTGYYFLAFSFGSSPIIYSWAIANVGGQTKKSTLLSFMNCATATGQLTGPLLLDARDAPRYLPGARSLMISQCVLVAAVAAQVVCLYLCNKKKQAQRVAMGKPKFIHDYSMDRKYTQAAPEAVTEANPNGIPEDRTDFQNEMFVYVY